MKIIDITETIEIANQREKVFAYLSDYTNDSYWRKEIKKVILDTPFFRKGSLIREVSFLSKKVPEYVSQLQCTDFQENKSVTSETVAENMFWAKNTRNVQLLKNQNTLVTYRLQFDSAIVKHGLGLRLPRFIVYFYTRSTMKKYLKALKNNLEHKQIVNA